MPLRFSRLLIPILLLLCLVNDAFSATYISLPHPKLSGGISLEEALLKRRSVRSYIDKALSLEELSQLLWAANGITDTRRGFRTAPSAGALYPIDIYVVINRVTGVDKGVYRYLPKEHKLELLKLEDVSLKLYEAALWQGPVKEASVVFILASFHERITWKYGQRGIRYAYIECGHICQNILLQATSLKLGAVPIGAFIDDKVSAILNLPSNAEPVYIVPVGKLQ
ncbi:MAG: SagB/ThcOx family dehydrogenase [Synergistetes bacterium]|nr:SagB/ThcOx family dehydrogenase [Synergistota bacterium]MCX8128342.1 SagB/ThcOx family dehydrogenase [Synergistota bacterium]MDW8192999.1 SagB/ThcOx family dehydrogenase [Synergistota bacterium]